jgi:hypothetical protein
MITPLPLSELEWLHDIHDRAMDYERNSTWLTLRVRGNYGEHKQSYFCRELIQKDTDPSERVRNPKNMVHVHTVPMPNDPGVDLVFGHVVALPLLLFQRGLAGGATLRWHRSKDHAGSNPNRKRGGLHIKSDLWAKHAPFFHLLMGLMRSVACGVDECGVHWMTRRFVSGTADELQAALGGDLELADELFARILPNVALMEPTRAGKIAAYLHHRPETAYWSLTWDHAFAEQSQWHTPWMPSHVRAEWPRRDTLNCYHSLREVA